MTNKQLQQSGKNKGGRSLPILSVILSVLCAISLWFYVIGVEDPTYTKTFDGIVVEIKNENLVYSNDLAIVSGKGYTISVTVRGRRSDINRYTEDDIVAFIDAGSINVPDTYQLRVQTEVPDGLTVTATSSSIVEVKADKTVIKTIAIDQESINVKFLGETSGFKAGEASIVANTTLTDTESISIEGAYSVVNRIAEARVKPISLDTVIVDGTVPYYTVDSELQFYYENGDVVEKADVSDIKIPGNGAVSIMVPVKQIKTFNVSVAFQDTADADDYEVKYTPAAVEVIGNVSDIEGLSDSDFTLVIPGAVKDNVGTKRFVLTLPEVVESTKVSTELSSVKEVQVTVTVRAKNVATAAELRLGKEIEIQ